MKKQIRTSRVQYILVSALIILVGLGTWISCSKDATVSSTDSTLRATKPALSPSPDFYPQTNINYDPFDGMNPDDRKNAIGGREAAEKYLQIVTYHLAHAMADDKARGILHENVPKPGEGEIHISQLIMDHPHFLTTISGDFKNSVVNKGTEGPLSLIIRDIETDSEAILKVSKALLDLEIRLVTTKDGSWEPSEKIPIFYTPLDDLQATVIVGVDANLKTVEIPIPEDKQTAPYAFLMINFDEDLLVDQMSAMSSALHPHPPHKPKSLWSLFNLFDSFGFTSPAYAHLPYHLYGEDIEHA